MGRDASLGMILFDKGPDLMGLWSLTGGKVTCATQGILIDKIFDDMVWVPEPGTGLPGHYSDFVYAPMN